MEVSVVVVAPIMILMALLAIAIPIAMGVFIYRDAKKRGMNAPLWTLVGVLAPGFIGLIIYLIVRGEHPDLQCSACGRPVSTAFAVCPYCGAPLKENCCTCGKALESGWIKCAYCGTDIPEEQQNRTTASSKGGKGIARLLGVIIAVPLVLMILLFTATCLFMVGKRSEWSGSYGITKESISPEADEVMQWLEDCDRSGEGLYVMRTSFRNGGELVSNLLLYRNDGCYDIACSTDSGGWFVEPCINFDFRISEDNGTPGYTLMMWEVGMNVDKEPKLSFRDGSTGKELEYVLSETDLIDGLPTNFVFDTTEVTENFCTVWIAGELTQVYGVEAALYADGEILESQLVANADPDESIAGESFDFCYSAGYVFDAPETADYTVQLSLCDENGQIIYSTEQIDLRDDLNGYLAVMFTEVNGEIEYNYKGD